MITKQGLVEHLRGLSYNAAEEDGVVVVRFGRVPTDRERKKLQTDIRKAGYESSWGWSGKGEVKE